jgi:hypothetical protein
MTLIVSDEIKLSGVGQVLTYVDYNLLDERTYTGPFVTFYVITNIYNKKTKDQPLWNC